MIEDPAESPETLAENENRITILQKCLKKLSAAHREVIDIVYYHQKTVDESAEIMGIPCNTVKTRMLRAPEFEGTARIGGRPIAVLMQINSTEPAAH